MSKSLLVDTTVVVYLFQYMVLYDCSDATSHEKCESKLFANVKVCFFTSLSSAMDMLRRLVHLTTLFPGQA